MTEPIWFDLIFTEKKYLVCVVATTRAAMICHIYNIYNISDNSHLCFRSLKTAPGVCCILLCQTWLMHKALWSHDSTGIHIYPAKEVRVCKWTFLVQTGTRLQLIRLPRCFICPGYEKHHCSPHCIKPVENEYGLAMVDKLGTSWYKAIYIKYIHTQIGMRYDLPKLVALIFHPWWQCHQY